jgi:hypothetical protein
LSVATFFLFISCNPANSKTDKPDIEKNTNDINKLLDNWHQSAAKADLDTYINIMDSGAIYIGTDPTENWTREEFATFCKPYFDKKTTWDFTPLQRNLYFGQARKTAWFDELLKTHMGTCRGSGALEKTNEQWKIKHYVLSMTIPNDDTEAVKKAKKKNDDAFLNSFN